LSEKTKKLQPLNDGFLKICEVTDTALPGEMPAEGLKELWTHAFAERTVGMRRYYEALRTPARIDMMVRCHLNRGCTTHHVIVMPDGEQYAIKQVQRILDTRPQAMDLSLERLLEKYQVSG
jgi:hypothetical protein